MEEVKHEDEREELIGCPQILQIIKKDDFIGIKRKSLVCINDKEQIVSKKLNLWINDLKKLMKLHCFYQKKWLRAEIVFKFLFPF